MERIGFKSSVGGQELSDAETVSRSKGMTWHHLVGECRLI